MRFFLFLFIPFIGFSQLDFSRTNEKTKRLAIKYLKKEDIPAMSISISYNDTIIFSEGFGFADLDKKTPVIPSKTKFEIASITKTITASILGKLYENGTLDWDKSPYLYLDSLPKKQYSFTIKQIAGHIAGLIRHPSEEDWTPENTYSKKDFYRVFRKDSLLIKPYTKFCYSNYGYKLLGFIIEKVTNKDVFQVQNEFVFEPLKMSNTFINDGIYDDNTVTFYSSINGELEKAKYVYNNSMYSSGCHLSTSEDLIKLGNGYLFPNRILKQETLIELIKSQKLMDYSKTNYGIGFFAGKDGYNNFYYGHGGGAISARSELKIYPNSKLVVVMLANKSKIKDDSLVEEIANNYIELLKH